MHKSIIKFSSWIFKISATFSNCSLLKIGSVCALYLDKLTIHVAFF